jgi:hypothetical protein
VWNRGQLSNQLRSHLKQYFPGALGAFQVRGIGLDSREARAILAVAPDPITAATLTKARLRSVLRGCGRQRNIDAWADRLHPIFAAEVLHQLPLIEAAMGRQTQALVLQLDAACRAADDLAEAAAAAFAQHPDAEILSSFPGIGSLTGARVLGEIGDDRARFRDARGLKAYAGSAPITIASGKSLLVHHRKVKTSAWPQPATYGSSAHCHHRRSKRPTTAAAPPATSTPPPCATCSTASSAASTTACRPGRPSTRSRPSQPPQNLSENRPLLDSKQDRMSVGLRSPSTEPPGAAVTDCSLLPGGSLHDEWPPG